MLQWLKCYRSDHINYIIYNTPQICRYLSCFRYSFMENEVLLCLAKNTPTRFRARRRVGQQTHYLIITHTMQRDGVSERDRKRYNFQNCYIFVVHCACCRAGFCASHVAFVAESLVACLIINIISSGNKQGGFLACCCMLSLLNEIDSTRSCF